MSWKKIDGVLKQGKFSKYIDRMNIIRNHKINAI